VNTENPAAKALFSEYKKRTGKEPFSPFAVASRYDGVHLIAKALEACGEDNECIKNWLYSMPPYQGVIGTFTFDKNRDPLPSIYTVYTTCFYRSDTLYNQ